jgi:hypothetical protein
MCLCVCGCRAPSGFSLEGLCFKPSQLRFFNRAGKNFLAFNSHRSVQLSGETLDSRGWGGVEEVQEVSGRGGGIRAVSSPRGLQLSGEPYGHNSGCVHTYTRAMAHDLLRPLQKPSGATAAISQMASPQDPASFCKTVAPGPPPYTPPLPVQVA